MAPQTGNDDNRLAFFGLLLIFLYCCMACVLGSYILGSKLISIFWGASSCGAIVSF